ncbi:MAG: SH3 domain-containing protein [Propionicimonas sp.]
MNRALRGGRAGLAWLVITASLLTSGLVVATRATAAGTTYTATTSVNVRAKASSSAVVLGQLAEGQTVLAAGKVSGDWLPISYNATTAYVWAEYLVADATAASVVTSGPAGRKTASENVNVRASASLDAEISSILPKGTVVQVPGLTSGDFTQVTINGRVGWIYSTFLTPATDTTPNVVARYTTTANLALRASASVTATNQGTISAGATVGTTGVHSGSYSQIVHKGSVGWVITGFLKAVAGTPAELVLPITTGKRYVTQAGVALRAAADAESAQLSVLTLGAALRLTGTAQNGFTEVIWDGGRAWAASEYLATSAATTLDLGSTSLNKLEPFGKAAVVELRPLFPAIRTIYGYRSSSAYSSDHPSGRAIDIMIPSYKSNVALGDAIAAYVIANGDRLHVSYVIWRQRNYRLTRGYWVKMADRGGDTANHYDHVHVSFFAS